MKEYSTQLADLLRRIFKHKKALTAVFLLCVSLGAVSIARNAQNATYSTYIEIGKLPMLTSKTPTAEALFFVDKVLSIIVPQTAEQNPEWIKYRGAIQVSAGRKTDILKVSLSAKPSEAAEQFVDAIAKNAVGELHRIESLHLLNVRAKAENEHAKIKENKQNLLQWTQVYQSLVTQAARAEANLKEVESLQKSIKRKQGSQSSDYLFLLAQNIELNDFISETQAEQKRELIRSINGAERLIAAAQSLAEHYDNLATNYEASAKSPSVRVHRMDLTSIVVRVILTLLISIVFVVLTFVVLDFSGQVRAALEPTPPQE